MASTAVTNPQFLANLQQQSLTIGASTCGYLAILADPPSSGLTFFPSSTIAGQLNIATPHGWSNGTKVRVQITSGAIEGYVSVVNANAIRVNSEGSSNSIELLSQSSYLISELPPSPEMDLPAILDREIARVPVYASSSVGVSDAPSIRQTLDLIKIPNYTSAPITFRHIVLLMGTGVTASTKSTAGANEVYLIIRDSPSTIPPGKSSTLLIEYELSQSIFALNPLSEYKKWGRIKRGGSNQSNYLLAGVPENNLGADITLVYPNGDLSWCVGHGGEQVDFLIKGVYSLNQLTASTDLYSPTTIYNAGDQIDSYYSSLGYFVNDTPTLAWISRSGQTKATIPDGTILLDWGSGVTTFYAFNPEIPLLNEPTYGLRP